MTRARRRRKRPCSSSARAERQPARSRPCRNALGDDHFHPLAQQRAKAGARFHHRIPVLGLLVPAPVERAEIIDDRQMRRRGEVDQAQARPRQPAAMVEQIVHVIEMAVGDPHRLAQHAGIGRFAAHQPFAHPLVHQRLDHFAEQFFVEPFGQPADFGAGDRIAVDHRHLVDRLVEIFDDRLAPDQRDPRRAVDQHRGFAGGIEVDILVAPLPRIFAHQLMRHALFAEHEADLARERTKRELEQLPHGDEL